MRCKGIGTHGKDMTIFVCDLAGVENVFNCTPGSTDSIRFAAKTLANKNYSRDLGGGILEEWGDHKKKRAGNIVKYLHKDMVAGKSGPKDPNCWPDGSPNAKGDLDSISEEYSLDLLTRIVAHYNGGDWRDDTGILSGGSRERVLRKRRKKKGKQMSSIPNINISELYDFYEEKLAKLPIIPESKEKGKMFTFLQNKFTQIFGILSNTIYMDKNTYPLTRILKGSVANWRGGEAFEAALKAKNLTEATDALLNDRNWGISVTAKNVHIPDFVSNIKNAFRGLQAPDCVSAFGKGLKSACEIRRDEGYIINNSLAQLTKDLKKISSLLLKKNYLRVVHYLVYADIYDEYSKYAINEDPLISWYDLQNREEREEDYGSILTAMCILGLGKTDVTKDEKTTF